MAQPATTALPTAQRDRPPAAPSQPVVGPAAGPGPDVSVSNGAVAEAAQDGSLFINLGQGLRLSASELEGRRSVIVDLSQRRPQPVPGLLIQRFVYTPSNGTGRLEADIDIPRVNNVRGGVRISVNRLGEASLSGQVRATTSLGVFNNPTLTLGIDEQNNISGSIVIEPADLTPRALRGRLAVVGGGTLSLNQGKLSGSVNASLAYTDLGSGRVDLTFNEAGELSGDGSIELTQPYLQGARATLVARDGNLSADVSIPASSILSPIPGLEIPEGNIHLTYENGDPGGALEGLKLRYPGFGEGTIDATIQKGMFDGGGTFNVTIAQMTEVSGQISYRRGRLTGTATVRSQDFPEGLPVSGGSITATLADDGAVSFRGEVSVTLGPAGSGQLRAAYEDGHISIGCTIDLQVPGLQGAQFRIDYVNGALEGEGDVPIDPAILQGITGMVHVEYKEQRWAGETELTYDADNGKLHGTVRVGVRQNEEGGLNVHGGGEVRAQIAPRLEGMLGVNILPDGTIDISGAITVTEPLELFPEQRMDRELFRYSQNIPLWAILVAVIRVRAGVRAGIGPGVFRDIRVEGEYTIGGQEEPSFSITGEMYIPAFVEAYVSFGAGLGLDVVLGSLTGGIEGVATAGIYGAISVIPELSYENGDYKIEGVATLAAGARLKVGLNAWAEIEALWVTVWDETWELAEWVWNVGPDLALQARMAYVFGHPEPPTLEFNSDGIDTERLIQDAMPEDGPGASGAREALQNRAEWRGATRRRGQDANQVPSDLQQQAAETPDAPAAPPRPQKPSRPPGGESSEPPAPGADPAQNEQDQRDAAQPPTGGEQARPASEIPGSDQPRYPGAVTLATLDEPPAAQPRTAEQQREDLAMAGRVLELAMDQVETSEQLGAYFPRIRERFGLASIGYVAVGSSVRVRASINPTFDKVTKELAQGREIAGKTTKIHYESGELTGKHGGSRVGIEMVADPLGPDHPPGSGPSGQKSLMDLLVTEPTNDADRKYIRGHLLNDRIGGEGTARNLFPITAQANQAHESAIESRVKQWVNDDRYWVYYRIKVEPDTIDLSHDASKSHLNKVNARLVCEASVYDLDNKKHNTISATIVSQYRAPASLENVQDLTGPTREDETGVKTRPEDRAAQIERSTREDEYRLNATVYNDLVAVHRKRTVGRRLTNVNDALDNVPGVGPALVDTLHKAYAASGSDRGDISGSLTSDERANLSRINALADEIHKALAPFV